MEYSEVMRRAREVMRPQGLCHVCDICDGRACGSRMPGPGAKGLGDGARLNYEAWRRIRLNLDTISENITPNLSCELFGRRFAMPIFAGPVRGVASNYGSSMDDVAYNRELVCACAEAGSAAFIGDPLNDEVQSEAVVEMKKANGCAVPTIKPWDMTTVEQKLAMVSEGGAFAAAMDIDGAGLPFLKNCNPPSGPKTVDELAKIIKLAGVPFILKGIMTVRGAQKSLEAGAAGIVVSNHGGRVLDQTLPTAQVLPEIARAMRGSGLKIFVDGGIRCGADVLKALALGADGVLIARPVSAAVYGAGAEGVKAYLAHIADELSDTMLMCGVHSLAEIGPDCVGYLK